MIGHLGADEVAPRTVHNDARGTAIRAPETQGMPSWGPIHVGGQRVASQIRVGYNAQHLVQWHWPIPAYLITKHVAAGSFLFLALTALVPALPFAPAAMVWGGAFAVALTLVTLALLLYDLDRPDRFFYLLIRPQWRSWVARAAWILSGFSAVTGIWWALETAAWLGLFPAAAAEAARPVFAVLSIPLAVLAATYTAFLFAQAEGRDLWQSPHLPVLMAVQAVVFGAAPFAALGVVLPLPAPVGEVARWTFFGALLASLAVTLVGDLGIPHASEIARRALRDMVHGTYRAHYWLGGVLLGHLVPLALLAVDAPAAWAAAFGAAAVGLFLYAFALVMAPQAVQNS
jgi:formate-dependent nitrite reductase membrane component NrfD